MRTVHVRVMAHGGHQYIEASHAGSYCEGCAFDESRECFYGDGSIAGKAEKVFGGDCITREVIYVRAVIEPAYSFEA